MTSEPFFSLGACKYYFSQQKLVDNENQELKLRPQSLAVLHHLLSKPDQVIAKDEIFQTVWPDVTVTDDSLVQCVADIRRVLGDKKHKILQTVPRRGYKLVPSAMPADNSQSEQSASPAPLMSWQYFAQRPAFALLLGIMAIGLVRFMFWAEPEPVVSAYQQPPINDNGGYASTLQIALSPDTGGDKSEKLQALKQEVQVALGRYRSVQLVDAGAEYQLLLDEHTQGDKTPSQQITLQLKRARDASTVFGESYELTDVDNAVHKLAIRAAAAVASPGVGAIGQYLLKSSRLKPVEELTPAECYAYGYGCTRCSGKEDIIDHRAKACLDRLLKQNPNDARAWALQATIYTHQYWFGSTLSEPARSNLSLRKHLPAQAIEAANKAEALSDGKDSSVYWGMAQAYMASCQPEKLYEAVNRGLAINPDDPNLLAPFGNWLAYSGYWDEGAAMTQKAIDIEPQHFKKWWLMSIAKRYYGRGEHEQAYQTFVESFNERNWLSHLQAAYTLPLLGRTDEAKKVLQELQKHYPGFTLEHALEFYKMYCFDDAFVNKIKQSLTSAGMPSRGNSDDLDNIQLPVAKTVKVNGVNIEYMDVGEGEPIVFVHGAVSDYRTWGHYLLPISEKHRYISYSRRYYGTQPWVDEGEAWSSDTHVADLTAFIEALDLGPVHLVSWSSGGTPASIIAAQRPELVKSVINYEPVNNHIMAGNAKDEALRDAWYARWGKWGELIKQKDGKGAAGELINVVFELPKNGFQQETELSKELIRYNSDSLFLGSIDDGTIQITCDYLKQVKVPMLIVYGEKTHAYWTRMSEKFATCTPGAKLAVMQGTNHKGPIEKVQEFTDLIVGFVEQH